MKIYILIVVGFLSVISYSQNSVFDYDVMRPSKNVYDISFHFYEDLEVQFIQIDLYDDKFLMGTYEAIINRKLDNNYYLFYNGKERLVYMDAFKLVIENDYGKLKIKKQFIEVRLLDKDFKLLETYRKILR